jgi:hypothetical protein
MIFVRPKLLDAMQVSQEWQYGIGIIVFMVFAIAFVRLKFRGHADKKKAQSPNDSASAEPSAS